MPPAAVGRTIRRTAQEETTMINSATLAERGAQLVRANGIAAIAQVLWTALSPLRHMTLDT